MSDRRLSYGRPSAGTIILLTFFLGTCGGARQPLGDATRGLWIGMELAQIRDSWPSAAETLGHDPWAYGSDIPAADIELLAGEGGPVLLRIGNATAALQLNDGRLRRISIHPQRPKTARATFSEVAALGAHLDGLGLEQRGSVMLSTLLRAEWFAVPEHCQIPMPRDNTIGWGAKGWVIFSLSVACERDATGLERFSWFLTQHREFPSELHSDVAPAQRRDAR